MVLVSGGQHSDSVLGCFFFLQIIFQCRSLQENAVKILALHFWCRCSLISLGYIPRSKITVLVIEIKHASLTY